MRKYCTAVVLGLLVLALVGCGESATPTATVASKTAAAATPAATTASTSATTVAPTAAVVTKTATVSSTATVASASGASWKIAVEGLDKEASFTNLDMQKLGTVKVKAAMKDKETTGPEQEWTGVPLAKVVESLGVTKYTTIKVEAVDGYSKEYTPDLVAANGTLLAIEVNGKALDNTEGPVQLVVNGKGSNWWIKHVVKITVNK